MRASANQIHFCLQGIDFASIHLWPDNWLDPTTTFVDRWLAQHDADGKNVLKMPVRHSLRPLTLAISANFAQRFWGLRFAAGQCLTEPAICEHRQFAISSMHSMHDETCTAACGIHLKDLTLATVVFCTSLCGTIQEETAPPPPPDQKSPKSLPLRKVELLFYRSCSKNLANGSRTPRQPQQCNGSNSTDRSMTPFKR